MKKQSLGKKILFVGSILTVAIACQPQASSIKSSQNGKTNENPGQSDNEDEDTDDGAYGDGDTSSSCGENGTQPVIKGEESEADVADVQDVNAQTTPSQEESVIEISTAKEEEPSSVNVVVLEAVTPVEIVPEYQEELASQSE